MMPKRLAGIIAIGFYLLNYAYVPFAEDEIVSEKVKPSNIKYLKKIRQKISNNVCVLYNLYGRRNDKDKVDISFVMLANGTLDNSSIIFHEGSSTNNIIRNITILGLKKSFPTKPFPKPFLQIAPEKAQIKVSISFQGGKTRKNRKISPGTIGVIAIDINDDIKEIYTLDSKDGIFIHDVFKDSPAEKAGLEQGDIVLFIDQTQLRSTKDLNLYLKKNSGNVTLITNRGNFLVERKVVN